MVAFAALSKAKPFATINASEIYSAVGKIAALRSEYNSNESNENKLTIKPGEGLNDGQEHNDGISVTNKTNSGSNSTSLVLTIGENFITQW
jgi:hypothetical protein